jgi:hypothetical protein
MKNPVTTLSLTAVAALAMVSGLATAQVNPQPPVMPTAPPVDVKPPMMDPAPPTPPPAADPAPATPQNYPACSKTVHDECTTKSGKVRHKHHHKA